MTANDRDRVIEGYVKQTNGQHWQAGCRWEDTRTDIYQQVICSTKMFAVFKSRRLASKARRRLDKWGNPYRKIPAGHTLVTTTKKARTRG